MGMPLGTFNQDIFAFVFNFSYPKSVMKWKNLRDENLFLGSLKKRGHVWAAGPRALQKFYFKGQRWLQLFFPFVVVLTSKIAAHGIRLAASLKNTSQKFQPKLDGDTPSLQAKSITLAWLYIYFVKHAICPVLM